MEDQLKYKVEVEIGREIRTRGDCELLSSLIAQRTGKLISYNTLRRFFGVDSKMVKPRLSTLDAISEFLSYKSYQHFIEHIPEDRIRNSNLRLSEALSMYNSKELAKFTLSLTQFRSQFIEAVIRVSRYYLLLKNVDDLLHYVMHAGLDKTHFSYDERLYIGNQIGILLRSAALPKRKFNQLIRSPFFNENLFEIFVDYGSLKKFFGDFAGSKPHSTSQIYFKGALRILICYAQNLPLPNLGELADVPDTLHPILLGRCVSLPLYYNRKIEASYIAKFEHSFSLGFFYEPMVASILTSNFQLHPQIKPAIKNYLNELQIFEMYYYHVYNLFEACHEYKRGNSTRVAQILQKVDPTQFRLSYKPLLSLFIYTLQWKVWGSNEAKEAAYQLSDSLDYERYSRGFIDSY